MIKFDSTEQHIKYIAIEPRNDIKMKAKAAALMHVDTK